MHEDRNEDFSAVTEIELKKMNLMMDIFVGCVEKGFGLKKGPSTELLPARSI